MVVLLAGGGGYTRREGLRRIKERLEKLPGADRVRYEPSALRPRTVVADVDIVMFLGRAFPATRGVWKWSGDPGRGGISSGSNGSTIK